MYRQLLGRDVRDSSECFFGCWLMVNVMMKQHHQLRGVVLSQFGFYEIKVKRKMNISDLYETISQITCEPSIICDHKHLKVNLNPIT